MSSNSGTFLLNDNEIPRTWTDIYNSLPNPMRSTSGTLLNRTMNSQGLGQTYNGLPNSMNSKSGVLLINDNKFPRIWTDI
jgi:hypothetical protein